MPLKLGRAGFEHKGRVRLGVRVRLHGSFHELGRRGPVVGHHVRRLQGVRCLVDLRHRRLAVDARRPRVFVAGQSAPELVEYERLLLLLLSSLLLQELLLLFQLQERVAEARLGPVTVAVQRASPGPRQRDRRVWTDVGELERGRGRGTAPAASAVAVGRRRGFGGVEHVLRVQGPLRQRRGDLEPERKGLI